MVDAVNKYTLRVDETMRPLIDTIAGKFRYSCTPFTSIRRYLHGSEQFLFDSLDEQEKMDFEAAVLWKGTMLYRNSLIPQLARFDAVIHGDRSWEQLLKGTEIRLEKPLHYYKELPYFYNACKVNFNATSRQMREAVNQRVFDVPACGAFLLTDYQDSMNELFEVNKEIIVYRHRDEIPEIIRFYLKYPWERERVAMLGRERVLKEHTYKHRLRTLIRRMENRYK
jgi:spore maturation protein CgeB